MSLQDLEHTCGVTEKGLIECFGWDLNGQTNGQKPKKATDGKFVGVGAGYIHTCGLTDKGLIECFGGNTYWSNQFRQAKESNGWQICWCQCRISPYVWCDGQRVD